MKEYELKLEQEKEEMRRKMIDDKKAIEAQKNLKESEKKELLEQLQKKEAEQEKQKTKQQRLLKKLKKMEEKVVVGTQVMEEAIK